MSQKDSFGLRLRAARERRGIALDTIAARTKVPVTVWQAMERNDFENWPSGLFARAYVRDYARAVGLDSEEVVEEFCRYFPNGDRRRGTLLRGHAEIIDIRSQYRDDVLPPEGDRRAVGPEVKVAQFPHVLAGRTGQRVLGAVGDVLAVCIVAVSVAQLFHISFLATLGVVSVGYYSVGFALLGHSPGFALAQMLARRIPQLVHVSERRMHA